MLLWDIIRDFFVQYIWGGTTSSNQYIHGVISKGLRYIGKDGVFAAYSDMIFFNAGFVDSSNTGLLISLSDWLSTTSTIIVLLGICIFLYLVTKYLFKFVSGLFKW